MATTRRTLAGKNFRVVTANVAKENRQRGNVLAMFRRLFANADVVLFQEVETTLLRTLLIAVAKVSGFTIWWPGNHPPMWNSPKGTKNVGGSGNACPIAYRNKRFKFGGRWNTRLVADGQRGNFPNEWLARIRLIDIDPSTIALARKHGVDPDRMVVRVWTVHMPPQAFTSKPQNKDEWYAAADYIERMTDANNDLGDMPIIGGGDMNRNAWRLPGATTIMPDEGTHGSAKYDMLYCYGFRVYGDIVIDLPGSDHDALIAEVGARWQFVLAA